jgi:hypothetical protein
MDDDSDEVFDPLGTDRPIQLDPVLAHTLLGTVAAAKGAVDTVLTHQLDGASGEALLRMAVRRLDHLAEQLRYIALGLPAPDVVPQLDPDG